MNQEKDFRQTVLVIDDEPDLTRLLCTRLESLGYKTLAANSGEEGLAAAEKNRPDLILLDLLMPKMKGMEVCDRLKADPRTAQIPVIFLTAMEMPEQIKGGLDSGAEDYLIKPVDVEQLKDRIRACLLRHIKLDR